MKVLQINNYHYLRGGSERYFLDISVALNAAGHDVQTFSTHSDCDVMKNLRRGGSIDPVNSNRPKLSDAFRSVYNKDAALRLENILDQWAPDVVHLHIYYGQLTASIIASIQKYEIPIVQTLHEYKLVCPVHSLINNGQYCESCAGRSFWKAAVNRCNRGSIVRSAYSAAESYISKHFGSHNGPELFIAVSNFQKEIIARNGVPKEKLVILPHYSHRVAYSGRSEDYFLYVGRLAQGKGLETLFDAYSNLPIGSPKLHIVGEGEIKSALVDQANRLGIQNKIVWRGHLSGVELQSAYSGAIAVINPSELNETFGLTVLEAMSYGKPVVVSQHGALPELVEHRKSGFIFKSRDELTECLQILSDDASTRQSMSRRNLDLCISKYSEEEHLDRLEDIYRQAIHSFEGRTPTQR